MAFPTVFCLGVICLLVQTGLVSGSHSQQGPAAGVGLYRPPSTETSRNSPECVETGGDSGAARNAGAESTVASTGTSSAKSVGTLGSGHGDTILHSNEFQIHAINTGSQSTGNANALSTASSSAKGEGVLSTGAGSTFGNGESVSHTGAFQNHVLNTDSQSTGSAHALSSAISSTNGVRTFGTGDGFRSAGNAGALSTATSSAKGASGPGIGENLSSSTNNMSPPQNAHGLQSTDTKNTYSLDEAATLYMTALNMIQENDLNGLKQKSFSTGSTDSTNALLKDLLHDFVTAQKASAAAEAVATSTSTGTAGHGGVESLSTVSTEGASLLSEVTSNTNNLNNVGGSGTSVGGVTGSVSDEWTGMNNELNRILSEFKTLHTDSFDRGTSVGGSTAKGHQMTSVVHNGGAGFSPEIFSPLSSHATDDSRSQDKSITGVLSTADGQNNNIGRTAMTGNDITTGFGSDISMRHGTDSHVVSDGHGHSVSVVSPGSSSGVEANVFSDNNGNMFRMVKFTGMTAPDNTATVSTSMPSAVKTINGHSTNGHVHLLDNGPAGHSDSFLTNSNGQGAHRGGLGQLDQFLLGDNGINQLTDGQIDHILQSFMATWTSGDTTAGSQPIREQSLGNNDDRNVGSLDNNFGAQWGQKAGSLDKTALPSSTSMNHQSGTQLGTSHSGADSGTSNNQHFGSQIGTFVGDQSGTRLGSSMDQHSGTKMGTFLGDQFGTHLGSSVDQHAETQMDTSMGDLFGTQPGSSVNQHSGNQMGSFMGDQFGTQLETSMNQKSGTQIHTVTGDQSGTQLGTFMGDQSGTKMGSSIDQHSGTHVNHQSGTQLGQTFGTKTETTGKRSNQTTKDDSGSFVLLGEGDNSAFLQRMFGGKDVNPFQTSAVSDPSVPQDTVWMKPNAMQKHVK